MGDKLDTLDLRIDEIASRQHGAISLRQLEAVGLGRRGVAKRAKSGRLHRIHRGVYAVGHRGLSLHGRFMAAVLACGDGAVISHVSAAVLWELLKPIDGPAHVTVPSTSGRSRRSGIHLHRCPSLNAPAEPSPSPSSLPIRGGRGGRLSSTHRFYRLDHIETDRTRSGLEALFLDICARYAIPHPEVNVKLGRWTVDFLWRSQRLVAETDFFTYHRGSVAFKDDHARDLDLRSAGYTVLRYDDTQLEAEPGRVAADVARALSQEVPHPQS